MNNSELETLRRENKWLHDSLQTNQRRACDLEQTIERLERQIQVMETFAEDADALVDTVMGEMGEMGE